MKRLLTGSVVLLALAGCSTHSSPGADPTITTTITRTSQPGGLAGGEGETGAPSTIVTTPTPSLSAPTNAAEKDGTCPYISNADMASQEGSRVGRVTVLQTKPVGCRFYFQYDAGQIIGEIDVVRYADSVRAYNAMVGSAKGHPEVQSDATIGDGAVAYKAPLQGSPAWLCVFAEGTAVVTVRTRQPYPAYNAFHIARTIAPKFK